MLPSWSSRIAFGQKFPVSRSLTASFSTCRVGLISTSIFSFLQHLEQFGFEAKRRLYVFWIYLKISCLQSESDIPLLRYSAEHLMDNARDYARVAVILARVGLCCSHCVGLTWRVIVRELGYWMQLIKKFLSCSPTLPTCTSLAVSQYCAVVALEELIQ